MQVVSRRRSAFYRRSFRKSYIQNQNKFEKCLLILILNAVKKIQTRRQKNQCLCYMATARFGFYDASNIFFLF